MKKLQFLSRVTAAAFAMTFFVIGCRKETTPPNLLPQEELEAAVFATQSEAESEFVFDDVFNNVMGVNAEVGTGGVGIFGRTSGNNSTAKLDSVPSCVKLTVSPLQVNVFPKTVVIDFGTGCDINGHIRSGKISTVYTGRLIEPGKSATTTFENFIIDTLSVSGTHRVTNTTSAGANQRQFKVEIVGGKLSRPNGNFEDWTATRVHTQIEGNGTVLPVDDVFRTTGSSRGKTKRGNMIASWQSEIQEPLMKKFSCRWFSKGSIQTTRSGLPTNSPWFGMLEFGDGTCDNKATLTINGNVHQIVLR